MTSSRIEKFATQSNLPHDSEAVTRFAELVFQYCVDGFRPGSFDPRVDILIHTNRAIKLRKELFATPPAMPPSVDIH